jgi:hypothetical protein
MFIARLMNFYIDEAYQQCRFTHQVPIQEIAVRLYPVFVHKGQELWTHFGCRGHWQMTRCDCVMNVVTPSMCEAFDIIGMQTVQLVIEELKAWPEFVCLSNNR